MAKENGLKDVNFGEMFTLGSGGGIDIPDTIKGNDDDPEEKQFQDETEGIEIIPFDTIKKPEPDKKVKDKEEEPTDEEKEKNTPSHDDIQDSSALSLVFAKFLNERGLLSNYDEKEFSEFLKNSDDENALEYLFNSEMETRLEEVKKSYDQDMQEYIELKDVGIDSGTASTLVKQKSIYENISDKDLDEDEDTRRKVLVQHYKNTTNFSPEKINKIVNKFVEDGDDIEEAKEALVEIRKFNDVQIKLEKKRVEEAEQAAEKRVKEAQENLKKTIYETKEILGQQVNKPTLQKLEKFLIEPVGKDAQGNPVDGITAWFMKNPVQARINLAYGIMTGLLDGKIDKLKEKAKTSAINDIENALKSKGSMVGGKPDMDISGGGNSTLKSMMESFKLD